MTAWTDAYWLSCPGETRPSRQCNVNISQGMSSSAAAKMPPMRPPRKTHSDQQQVALWGSGCHFRSGFEQKHIDLAANPEPAGQVDAGLDGEPDARDQCAFIGRLEIVQVRPRAMQVAVDGMPRPVHELLAIAGRADHPPRRVVERRPGNRLAGAPPLLEQRDRSLPRA